MSRSFASASSQYLEKTSAPVTAHPLTMACWFNAASDPGATTQLMGIGRSGAVTSWSIGVAFGVANNPVVAMSYVASSAGTAITSGATAVGTGQWHHACGVFSSTTSRDAYLNGGESGNDTNSRSVASVDQTRVGCRPSSSASAYFDGLIAEAGIWSVALTAAEIAALAKGVSPLLVRRNALVCYWPLVGRQSPEIDLRGNAPLTLMNTPTTGAHPRIFLPHGQK